MHKIIHIGVVDKFLTDFVELNERRLNNFEHEYFLISRKNEIASNTDSTSSWKNFLKMLKHRKKISDSSSICLHGIFDSFTLIYFFLYPKLLKKAYWFIWGGDVHGGILRNNNLKYFLKEKVRKFVLTKIPNYVTYIFEDFQLATSLYNPSANHIECILYPSNVFKSSNLNKNVNKSLRIMLGNSADRANRHKELINMIKPYVDTKMEVIIPITYGNSNYAKEIIEYANDSLMCKVTGLYKHLNKDEFIQLLNSIDIAYMNHKKRQMGMGTTIQLLGLGKTVFFPNNSDACKVFTSLGLHVSIIEETTLSINKHAKENIELIQYFFSEDRLTTQLEHIYENQK